MILIPEKRKVGDSTPPLTIHELRNAVDVRVRWPPGAGTLCVLDQDNARDPIQSTAAPRQGPIAYIGAAGDTMYFATRPGVTWTTMDGGAVYTYTYTLDGTDELQLQPLGNGWHAVGTGFGTMATSVTLRA